MGLDGAPAGSPRYERHSRGRPGADTLLDVVPVQVQRERRVSRGFFFETDMLIHLYYVQAVVADVQMPAHYGDEQSTLSPRSCWLIHKLTWSLSKHRSTATT